jgi:hypothetical protein
MEQLFCPVTDAPLLTAPPVNVIWVSPVEGTAGKIQATETEIYVLFEIK